MPVLVVPNVFVNGTIADATLVDANFNAVSTIVNGLDWVNIGANGIFASQIIPTTAAQALFGGNFGYTFNPNSASQVPLTLQAVTGQSVDLFDVFLAGVKVMSLDLLGNVVLGPTSNPTAVKSGQTPAGGLYFFGGVNSGAFLVTGAHYNYATSQWVADAAVASIIGTTNNGNSQIFYNAGLTPGVNFTPAQILIVNGSTNVATFVTAVVAGLGMYPGNGGLAGSPGAVWSGTGAPPNTLGANGDYYFNRTGAAAGTHIYYKSAGAWAGLTGATL